MSLKFSEILEHIERGYEVEFRSGGSTHKWMDFDPTLSYPISLLFSREFRLKPNPMEIWVNVYGDKKIIYATKSLAERGAGTSAIKVAVHFREVVE